MLSFFLLKERLFLLCGGMMEKMILSGKHVLVYNVWVNVLFCHCNVHAHCISTSFNLREEQIQVKRGSEQFTLFFTELNIFHKHKYLRYIWYIFSDNQNETCLFHSPFHSVYITIFPLHISRLSKKITNLHSTTQNKNAKICWNCPRWNKVLEFSAWVCLLSSSACANEPHFRLFRWKKSNA